MKVLVFLFMAMGLCACSTLDRLTIKTTAPLLYKGSNQILAEGNWEKLRAGLPASLILVEGLWSLSPQNSDLLLVLLKGHAGYTWAVSESLYLNEKYQDVTEGPQYLQCLDGHSRAVEYGLRYLELNDIEYPRLMKLSGNPEELQRYLDRYLSISDKNIDAVFFTGQALAGLIQLQMHRPAMVAQLPVVQGLFTWACHKRPDLYWGACSLFDASYFAILPPALGGKPQESKKLFEQVITKYPDNWVAHAFLLQYYIIPRQEKELYDKEVAFFKEAQKRFKEWRHWGPLESKRTEQDEQLRLYQAVALKRFEIIQQNATKIFK